MRATAAHRTALLDWLACAVRGAAEPAARAARAAGDGPLEHAAALGAAGHVLDFDDTYLPGLVHLSAPTAPAALALGAELGASVGDVLDAYAAGFEATAALAAASHPALYERGWHPTAVCGTVGAATTAAVLLGLDGARARAARALAVLRAGGLQAAFGSDGKALQVGMAAAAGVHAARLAAAGARGSSTAADGFAAAFGGRWAEPSRETSAVEQNWIKAYPCCLQTHSAIEAAEQVRAHGEPPDRLTVAVHPVSRRAAPYDDVGDGLQAKFSIPYLVAFTLLHAPPTIESFAAVDEAARELARAIAVRTDASLLESEALIESSGDVLARVEAALGSPGRPMDAGQLHAKVHALAGGRLDGALEDRARPAADLLTLAVG